MSRGWGFWKEVLGSLLRVMVCMELSLLPLQWESASVSYGKATPYFPVVDLLKRYVHVEDADDPRTIRAKVTGQILTLDASLQETIPALLSLLDALPEDSPFLQLDPPQRRQRTLDGLKRILLRESQVQPLLLVFEDLHWIDSETRRYSTAWSRAYAQPNCCSWSITVLNTPTTGVARPTARNCDLIHYRLRVPMRFWRRCWEMTPVWNRSRRF
jgi:hypothetical protein